MRVEPRVRDICIAVEEPVAIRPERDRAPVTALEVVLGAFGELCQPKEREHALQLGGQRGVLRTIMNDPAFLSRRFEPGEFERKSVVLARLHRLVLHRGVAVATHREVDARRPTPWRSGEELPPFRLVENEPARFEVSLRGKEHGERRVERFREPLDVETGFYLKRVARSPLVESARAELKAEMREKIRCLPTGCAVRVRAHVEAERGIAFSPLQPRQRDVHARRVRRREHFRFQRLM